MNLRKPFDGDYPVSQRFGENPAIYRAWGFPGHNGIDWAIPRGVPILAPCDGEARVYWDPMGYGQNVEVHFDGGNAIVAHGVQDSVRVHNGAMVRAGDRLFDCDSTGFSTGDHVHLGLKLFGRGGPGWRDWVDPEPYIATGEGAVTVAAPLQPRLRLGVHAAIDGAPYPAGMPCVELAYAFDASPGLDLETRAGVIRSLRNRQLRPLLRIDYKPGQTCPRTEAELSVLLSRLDGFLRAFPDLDGIDVAAFNEPNLAAEGAFAAPWVARCWNGAGTPDTPENSIVGKLHGRWPRSRAWAPASLPYGSNIDGGRGSPPNGENSIWARWYYDFLVSAKSAWDMTWARQFHGFLLHAYARPEAVAPPLRRFEPWQDVRSADHARFGTNVLDTWRECLDAAGFSGQPVWVSEFNSGASEPPSTNYPRGLLLQARDRLLLSFGDRAEALCWFTGRHDGVWQAYSLEEPQANMSDAELDHHELLEVGA